MAYVSTRSALVLALAIVLMIILAAPALAVEKAPFDTPPEGEEYGLHHAAHAKAHQGFTADMNPGEHEGMYGWMGPDHGHHQH